MKTTDRSISNHYISSRNEHQTDLVHYSKIEKVKNGLLLSSSILVLVVQLPSLYNL